MQQLLQGHPLVLMEAAITERLRRSPDIRLHPTLVNTPLIYEPRGQAALRGIYQEYIVIAAKAGLPLLLCTPTWRAGHDRVQGSHVSQAINVDAAHFMRRLRDEQPNAQQIKIGGLLGPRGDCYAPEDGLSTETASEYHAWQIEQLMQGGVDYLLAQTLPNVHEALGIAQALAATDTPYIISFVITREGKVMDGSSLLDAVQFIDDNTRRKPLGYMVNCAYPAFLCPESQPMQLYRRLIGYQANASSLDHCDLDGAVHLHNDPVEEWGRLMLALNRRHGVKILGGCCGTDGKHLDYLVKNR